MPRQIGDAWEVDPKIDRIITAGFELSNDVSKASVYIFFSGVKTLLRVIDKVKNTDLTYELDAKIPPGTGVKFQEIDLNTYQ